MIRGWTKSGEVVAPGILTAIVTATCTATACGLAAGRLTTPIAWLSLAAGVLACAVAIFFTGRHFAFLHRGVESGKPVARRKPLEWAGHAVAVVFVLFVLRTFLWHVSVLGGDSLVVGSTYNHGDLSLHLALVRHLAQGASFWPESLLLADHKMAYPLGTDLFHALLVLVGVPVLAGFAWIGLVSGALTLQYLWRWGGAFAVATFLFVGGLQVFEFASHPVLRDLMADWDWKSIPLALYTTQRGLLIALPAGLALLTSWRSRHTGDPTGSLPFVMEWLLYASLPLFHIHSFLFLSVALAGFFCLGSRSARRSYLLLGLAAVGPATACVLLVVDITTGQISSVAWQPGWMQGEANPLFYWSLNFGLWLPLMAVTLVVALCRWHKGRQNPESRSDLTLAGLAVLVFAACCLVRFAPWAWDNTKLMLWCFLVLAPVAWKLVLSKLAMPLRVTALAMLTATGILTLAAGLRLPDEPNRIARLEEVDRVALLLSSIPPDARIAAAPEWNHPVILLGYSLALGYDGHLWSHGYDYGAQKKALYALMEGKSPWQPHAALLKTNYIFWGPREQETFGHSLKSWIPHARVVASDKSYGILYMLRDGPMSE